MQGLYTYYNNKTVNLEDIRQKVYDGLIENKNFYEADPKDKIGFQMLLPVLLDEAFESKLEVQELPKNQKWLGMLAQQAVADWNNENKKEVNRIRQGVLQDIHNQNATEISFWSLFSALIQSVTDEEFRKLESYLNNTPSPAHELKISHHPFYANLNLALHPETGPQPLGLKPFDQEVVHRIYNGLFKELPEYLSYKEKSDVSEQDQEDIWKVMYRKLFRSEIFNETMTEMDMHWSENRILLEVSLKSTFKELSNGNVPIFIAKKEEEEEFASFFNTLFSSSLENFDKDEELMKEAVINWEADRVAVLDKWIIHLAINEMRQFPHIPVKVTMNEYLEIAKAYSTPGSAGFINGVVDKIASLMKAEGGLKKSARGLMDNR
jgi:N utilization substance protein B